MRSRMSVSWRCFDGCPDHPSGARTTAQPKSSPGAAARNRALRSGSSERSGTATAVRAKIARRQMRLGELVVVSNAVADTNGRLDKIGRLADLLKRLAPGEIPIAVAFLGGSPVQGRIGVAGSIVAAAQSTAPAAEPTLDLHEVDTY